MRIISFIILSLIFISNLYGASPKPVTSEVTPELNQVWENKITFWFERNILYWIDLSTKDINIYNWIQFQLDHKDPPTVNKEPVSSIKVTEKEVFVIAGDKCWILNYEGNPVTDWYVEDPFSL